ncbi:hypothetical protein [uncultured Salinicola sp.]|uniref:hypothetical protein n=1 Tax=uncultured Salinicola sp. TaxID=1193542 RepID=UPI0026108E1A|nr:hypothetical protein [uncultured Salinicola sp.]|tara:strand:- start:1680 stop:2630 length:951 start_codon:yes stop_codon:yes gene_type:complete
MKTELHKEIDGIHAALKARGVDLKRSDVIESVAIARGHRNAHEMMAAAQKTQEEEHPFADQTTKLREDGDSDLRHQLRLRTLEVEQLREDIKCTEMRSNFDWIGWKKTIKAMKKAAHHGKDPISDEDLMLIRMAVSDNHCKSSSAERSSAEYRVMELAKKRLPAILSRLDAAEELLGKGEVVTGPILEAIKDMVEVEANRDGDLFDDYFLPDPDSDLDEDQQGVLRAAKAFSIDDLHTLSGTDEDDILERIEELEADMDSCQTGPASVRINVAEAVEALRRGEGSILLHRELMAMARAVDIDPRGTKGVIYPKHEG